MHADLEDRPRRKLTSAKLLKPRAPKKRLSCVCEIVIVVHFCLTSVCALDSLIF